MFRWAYYPALAALVLYVLVLAAFLASVAVLAVRALVPPENQPAWFSSALEADPRVVPALMFFVGWVVALALLVDCYLAVLALLSLLRSVLRGMKAPLMLAFAGIAALAAEYAVAAIYGREPRPWALYATGLWDRTYGWVLDNVVAGDWVSSAGDLVWAIRHLQIPPLR